MRWLWKDWPAPIKADPEGKSRQDTDQILIAGEEWILVSEGHRFTEGPAANDRGELFFTDVPNSRFTGSVSTARCRCSPRTPEEPPD